MKLKKKVAKLVKELKRESKANPNIEAIVYRNAAAVRALRNKRSDPKAYLAELMDRKSAGEPLIIYRGLEKIDGGEVAWKGAIDALRWYVYEYDTVMKGEAVKIAKAQEESKKWREQKEQSKNAQ